MRKSTKRIPIGSNQTRWIVTLLSEEVVGGMQDMIQKQYDMLRTLVDQPEMMNCGPGRFQKMRMFFSGAEWVMELEATEGIDGSTSAA